MARFASQSLIVSAIFLGVAHAEPNSTFANTTMVGWVSPAPRRSTWDIIWSCLSIFIVCSWKCVHLNIPTHEEIQGEWHTMQICKGIPDISIWPKAPLRRKWRRKIGWMTFIALAPEFGVALAAKQYLDARRDLKEFRKDLSSQFVTKYTMAHAFYVQMGGIVIYEHSRRTSTASNVADDPATNQQPTNEVLNGIDTESQGDEPSQASGSTGYESLTARMARSLSDIQPDMFRIPESEIKDLSKADVITKAFAIIQCTWLVVQSICRTAQGYNISLLELATLAFIFCAFLMQIFWWNKPFDVESRRIVMAIPFNLIDKVDYNTLSIDDMVALDDKLFRERIQDLSGDSLGDILYTTAVLAHPEVKIQHFTDLLPSFSLYIASTTFLAIHLSAWKWEFPSFMVRYLWRWLNVGTLAASFTPIIGGIMTTWGMESQATSKSVYFLGGLMVIICGPIYVLSRLGVLGLTFYCLLSMPESTYTTLDWLAWVPHFS